MTNGIFDERCSVLLRSAILVYPRESHQIGTDPFTDNHAIHTEPQPRFY